MMLSHIQKEKIKKSLQFHSNFNFATIKKLEKLAKYVYLMLGTYAMIFLNICFYFVSVITTSDTVCCFFG